MLEDLILIRLFLLATINEINNDLDKNNKLHRTTFCGIHIINLWLRM